ncbi:MAG TPA: DNA-binding protein, partial [Xenococcaceae cyanobacterium]
MSKDKILTACYQLLEEGKSVTVRAVIDRVGGSSRDISPIVKEFKEKLEAESSLSVSEKAEVNTSDKDEEDFIDTNPVTANLERVDKEAQLIAARKIV